MTYSKPEVAKVGDAAVVIQSKKQSVQEDSPTQSTIAAYELDEE